MLNLFAATEYINYAKCARLYLQMMPDLPTSFPELYEKFSQIGYNVVRRNDRLWSGIWTFLRLNKY